MSPALQADSLTAEPSSACFGNDKLVEFQQGVIIRVLNDPTMSLWKTLRINDNLPSKLSATSQK